jgi:hypothetical protein
MKYMMIILMYLTDDELWMNDDEFMLINFL